MIKPSPEQMRKWIKKNFGDDYKEAKKGKEVRINNPLSIDDSYHLWINLEKAIVNDFRPSYKNDVRGTFLSFVMKYKKVGFRSAVSQVMGDVNISDFTVSINEIEEDKVIVELPSNFEYLTYDDSLLSKMIKAYLNNRCIPNSKAYVLGVGYCGLNVLFPYKEFGEVVYWQQRSISNKRFLFPEDSNKADFIYGLDMVDPTEPVIVTESIFNSLMFDNGVAIGGSDISQNQKQKLRKIGAKKIIMALDYDKAGVAGTVKSYNLLDPYFDVYYSFTNDCEKDWNDLAIDFDVDRPLKVLKGNIAKLDFKSSVKLKLLCSSL